MLDTESKIPQAAREWRSQERPKQSSQARTVEDVFAQRERRRQEAKTADTIRQAIDKTRSKALEVAKSIEGEDIDLEQLAADRKAVEDLSGALSDFEKAGQTIGNMKGIANKQEAKSRIGGKRNVDDAVGEWRAEISRRWVSVRRREKILAEQENQKKDAA